MRSSSRPTPARNVSHPSQPSPLSPPRSEIRINVYDLLPPGKLSTLLWVLGGSLLHSGITLHGREYAYGGHDRPNISGVYYSRPRLEPPGGTFRCEILAGVCVLSPREIDDAVKEASQRFLGRNYNLLTHNCNHFTSYLCLRLTGKPAPAWVNRAASIGLALPCVVPREWVNPPDHDTADGELLDDSSEDERALMIRRGSSRPRPSPRVSDEDQASWHDEMNRMGDSRTPSWQSDTAPRPVVDSSGRPMPAAERAPVPRVTS